MSYATIAYIPPARLNRDSFLRNLDAFDRGYPVIFFSDVTIENTVTIPIPDPTSIKLSKNRVALHNRLFLHAIDIAVKHDLKRFIYLESDCRVGRDHWDRYIFEEAEQYKDMFCAGTPSTYNEHAMTEHQKMWVKVGSLNYGMATGFSVPNFKAKKSRPMGAWFIMGAGGCYNTSVMADLFMGFEQDAHQKAIKVPAFDLFIGMRCFQLFGARAVQKLPFLTSVFSTFGDRINTESDRIQMVKSGRWSIVHQIKSDNDCL